MRRAVGRLLGKARFSRNDGQSAVLFALLLPLLFVFVAFAVDSAHAFVDYRHLQNAADAAALAAAQDVAGGGASCTTCGATATNYATLNGFTVAGGLVVCSTANPSSTPNCYQWPYVDAQQVTHHDEVLVRLNNCTPTFFGNLVGVPSICESVSSVGRSTPLTNTTVIPGTTTAGTTLYNTVTNTTVNNGTTNYSTTTTSSTIPGTTSAASTVFSTSTSSHITTTFNPANDSALFASDMTCSSTSGIYVDKNNATISGSIHSNGSITLGGNNDTVDYASFGQSGGSCGASGSSYGTTTLDTSDNSPPLASVPWPANWTSPGTATICAGATTTTTLSGSYAGGTYCNLSGNIDVQGPPSSGKLTVVAQTISVSGNNQTFPNGNYTQSFGGNSYGLLFYATTGSITISGNGETFPSSGFLFAPAGTIDLQKNNGSNGFWEAKDIHIEYNNFSMTGNGPGGTPVPTTSTTFTTTSTPVSTVAATTAPSSTTYSTSTSTTTVPASTVTNTTTTPAATIPGTTTGSSTQTATTGTNIGLGQ